MVIYLCDAAMTSLSKIYGDVKKEMGVNKGKKGPAKQGMWGWNLTLNNIAAWQHIFNQLLTLDPKSMPMLSPPKPYTLDPTRKIGTGGGYLTDRKGDLLTSYENDEVRIGRDYNHGQDYIDIVNTTAAIPAFVDLHTVVGTLREYSGKCEDLTLEHAGRAESLERFKDTLYKKGVEIKKTYENAPDDDPV